MCISGVSSVEELSNIVGIPAQFLRPNLAEMRQQWQLIGGAAGIRSLSEPILRAFDAFDRMGVLNLV